MVKDVVEARLLKRYAMYGFENIIPKSRGWKKKEVNITMAVDEEVKEPIM